MSQQQVTTLCLFGLVCCLWYHRSFNSPASLINFKGKVISWLTSYLSSHRFIVTINSTSSAQSSLSQGVPQGSVLSPLLFILYTTPPCSPISLIRRSSYVCWWQSTFNFFCHLWILHHYFTPLSNSWSCLSVDIFQSFVTYSVQNRVILIGLLAQLYKISDPCLTVFHAIWANAIITPTSSARNLGVIFNSALSMSDHISSVSKSCFLSIPDLSRIRNTLDYTTSHTIATSLIHSKLDYCNSLFLNFPQCQLNRLQLILNFSTQACSL